MPVRSRAQDLQPLAGRHEGLPVQRASNQLDQPFGQVREITEGLVLDPTGVAVAAAQEVRGQLP